MPTPKKDESEEDFVERCIPVVIDEGKEQDEAVAQCHSMWRQAQEDFQVKRGIYLAEPHGHLTYDGRKKAIAKADILPLEGKHILVSKDKAYGIMDLSVAKPVTIEEFDERFDEHRVTTKERTKWWDGKDELYLYEIKEFEEFDPPREVDVPDNVKFVIREVQFKDNGTDEEKDMETDEKVVLGPQSLEMQIEEIGMAFRGSPVVETLVGSSDGVEYSIWIAATYPDLGYLITEWKNEFYKVNFVKQNDDYQFASFDEWQPAEKLEEWVLKLKAMKDAVETESEKKEDMELPGEKAGRRIRGDKVGILKDIQNGFSELMDKIKDILSFAEYDDKKPKEWFEKSRGFKTLELKDGRTGLLTWTTNAFKDREEEIFTTKSLEDLVERYSERETKGDYKFWHIPGSKFGDILWQGVSGRFLVELGVFDDTKVGKAFKQAFKQFPDGHPEVAPEGWGTSHGFKYRSEDREDGVYEWFDKEETSVLPMSAAANPWNPKMEVLEMDEKQKTALAKLVPDDVVELIETTGETETKRLEDEKVEFKEKKEVEEAVVEEEPKSDEIPEDKEGAKEEEVEEKEYLTLDDVKPALEGLAEALKSVMERVDNIDASLKTLAETDEKKIEQKIELTPKESLKSAVESVIGKKETEVDGRTKLAKDGPEESEPMSENSTGITFIDQIKARNAEKHRAGAFRP